MCFFFNDTATTEIYTLSLHDALPILLRLPTDGQRGCPHEGIHSRRRPSRSIRSAQPRWKNGSPAPDRGDRKSTRLNSSHVRISYAVFCLKKKKLLSDCHLQLGITRAI